MTFAFPVEEDPNEYNGTGVIVCGAITTAVATVFVAARFYSRVGLLHTVGWEDWFILLALVFSYATTAGMFTQLLFGLGRRMQFVLPKLVNYTKSGLFTSLAYSLSLTFTKISILCLYIRILTYDKIRLLGKILLAIVIISHLWIVITILISAVPLQAFWDWNVEAKFRMPPNVYWGNSALNMVTDFLIFSLPLPVIFRLRIAKRQKIGLYLVFLLAFGVCIVSLVRMVWLIQMHHLVLHSFYDVTWRTVTIANWTMIEVNAAIICACLTTLRPLLTKFFPRTMASHTGSSQNSRNQPNMIAGYERPLTVGTRPNRPNIAFRASDDSSSFVLNEISTIRGQAKAGDQFRSNNQSRETHQSQSYDVEAQTHGDFRESVEVEDIKTPPKSHVRPTESHDSLRGYSSTPVSQHRAF